MPFSVSESVQTSLPKLEVLNFENATEWFESIQDYLVLSGLWACLDDNFNDCNFNDFEDVRRTNSLKTLAILRSSVDVQMKKTLYKFTDPKSAWNHLKNFYCNKIDNEDLNLIQKISSFQIEPNKLVQNFESYLKNFNDLKKIKTLEDYKMASFCSKLKETGMFAGLLKNLKLAKNENAFRNMLIQFYSENVNSGVRENQEIEISDRNETKDIKAKRKNSINRLKDDPTESNSSRRHDFSNEETQKKKDLINYKNNGRNRDQERRDLNRSDQERRDHNRNNQERRDLNRSDQERRDHNRNNQERRDHNRNNQEKRDHNRNDQEKRDHNRNDQERRDHNRNDQERRDLNRSGQNRRDSNRSGQNRRDSNRSGQNRRDSNRNDQNRRLHNRSDQERRDLNRSDQERRGHYRSDQERKDHNRSDQERRDHNRNDHRKQEREIQKNRGHDNKNYHFLRGNQNERKQENSSLNNSINRNYNSRMNQNDHKNDSFRRSNQSDHENERNLSLLSSKNDKLNRVLDDCDEVYSLASFENSSLISDSEGYQTKEFKLINQYINVDNKNNPSKKDNDDPSTPNRSIPELLNNSDLIRKPVSGYRNVKKIFSDWDESDEDLLVIRSSEHNENRPLKLSSNQTENKNQKANQSKYDSQSEKVSLDNNIVLYGEKLDSENSADETI